MKSLLLPLFLLLAASCTAQTRQDTLRGSNERGRDWWDVQRYWLSVGIDLEAKSIVGQNEIDFRIVGQPNDSLQLDLQEPMNVDSIRLDGKRLSFAREGNVFWVTMPVESLRKGDLKTLIVTFHGAPRVAKHPPWDGGFIWTKDANGKNWVAVACQGLGASAWWPCKDFQGDEPDSSSVLSYTAINDTGHRIPHHQINTASKIAANGLEANSTNGFLQLLSRQEEGLFLDEIPERGSNYSFRINNPINPYNLTFYLGDYATFTDTFQGENGVLPLTFHPLRYNEAKARTHFAVVKDMLRCFEHWMGPYPFYEDGYKLVEAPYLGMEHQSAVAYGNGYQMGYLGRDRSGTGVGMLFDYIIIHESGHEWFGNNITAKDVADNWIHEGFTTYTETLFAEWIAGKEKAAKYNKGEWKNIENDRPIIGNYGINDDGSGDKYDKGTAILHMIRTVVADDEKFRQILRGLNKDFWHQTVTTKQVEDYITQKSGYDFFAFFNQYLRTTQIPKLEWYREKGRVYYRFSNVVRGFSLPVALEGVPKRVLVSEAWNSAKAKRGADWEDNFLMKVEKVSGD